MEWLAALRDQLVGLARDYGCEPADAEDLAQLALQRLVERGPALETPEAYATRVVLRQLARQWRDRGRRAQITKYRARELAHLAGEDQLTPMDLLEDRERWLVLAAAMEQFVSFDDQRPRGRTLVVVRSVDDADPETTLDVLRFYARVVEELPRGARHKQRARRALFDGIADAHQRAGVVVQDPLPEPDDDEEEDWGALYVTEIGRREQHLSARALRGCALALRLCPELTMDEAVDAARRADAASSEARDGAGASPSHDEAETWHLLLHEEGPGDAPDRFDAAMLAAQLRRLQARRDPEAELTIAPGDVDVIRLRIEGRRLHAVAAAGSNLPLRLRLSGVRLCRLRDLGWRRPRPAQPRFYSRSWPVPTDVSRPAVAAELNRVLSEVYGVGNDDVRMELSFDS